ncbi:MAG TPA: AIR synthase-related protein [Saprospiraceae bacterium]|nr:AIR synthase-related protein [Saprospiraceae bacterium]
MENENSLYLKRGVSASKDEVHKAIAHLDKGLYKNAFCKILSDVVGQDDEFCNIMHADTAGTKTSLAYIYWKETGDLSVWSDIVIDAMVMNLDDMACVGCINDIVISSTIGRNKLLIPAEVLEKLISGSSDFIKKLKSFGINIAHAGGETADVGDIVRTVDVGFTTFARMKREDLIINKIKPGNVIVGLASFGQSIYEDHYNSGLGSNGFTSARHDIFNKFYAEMYPESYNDQLPDSVVYNGSKRLTDNIHIEGKDHKLGKVVLSPTRTYMPVLNEVFKTLKHKIDGLIHCTGGGQTKVIKFIENCRIVKNNLFDLPPIFELIQSESNAAWKEMYQVFNMGHRMEFYVDKEVAAEIIAISSKFGIEAKIIGKVEDCDVKEVCIKSPYGSFSYFS